MANPEGYRKALRLMRLAKKFKIPVVTMVDTPGATQVSKQRKGDRQKLLQEIFMKCLI